MSTDQLSESSEWYRSAFGRLYPLVYAHRDDESAVLEAAAMVELLDFPTRDVRMLDICCGAGRHMAAFVDMGFDVLGADLSPILLDEAFSRPAIRGRVVRADMRRLPFTCGFNVAVNLFTSFGYFTRDEENETAAREMARVLLPGGTLLLDHMNRASVERQAGDDTKERGGFIVHQKRWIEGDRIMKQIEAVHDEQEPIRVIESVRMYAPEEMTSLLERAGFTNVQLLGSLAGDPLTSDSDRMIAVAKKGNP